MGFVHLNFRRIAMSVIELSCLIRIADAIANYLLTNFDAEAMHTMNYLDRKCAQMRTSHK
jgi:hypothetical protein